MSKKLCQYNPVDIERYLRETEYTPPFPPGSDRAAWMKLAENLGIEKVKSIFTQAEKDAATPIPPLPASLFLECKRTGQREGYQVPRSARRTMLRSLVFAECLEYSGRFLDPILDLAWAILEESSWDLPAHQLELTDFEHHIIDLGAASTALDLAELDSLLGPVLDSRLGMRIRYEINQRIFIPYLTRHDHWWMYRTEVRDVNNWTAVCTAGVVGSALYLEKDLSRLAEIIARGIRSMDDYLATFDRDGGSTEGPGYWGYGFGFYVVLAHLLEHRTNGKINLFAPEKIHKIAQFPLRTNLSPQVWVNFSDCDRNFTFNAALLAFLARRLDIPALMALAQTQPEHEKRQELAWGLRFMFWMPDQTPLPPFVSARHDWYPEMTWMFSRYDPENPDALSMAVKGGHNAEMHNQNDVGNIIVHLNQESLIADVGRGRYTLQYFGPQRYEFFANSSLGHSVPLPAGFMQKAGREYCAQVLLHESTTESDTLVLEMKNAYPSEAGLSSLQRKVVFHREAPTGWIELEDSFEYTSGSGIFETALTTFSEVDLGENGLLIKGTRGNLRIGYDPAAVQVRVDLYEDVDLSDGLKEVRRIVFEIPEPAHTGKIRLEIVPV
ncbi:MAG TPA: heparinase II/III family protein [Anaerolineaceae bacterium]